MYQIIYKSESLIPESESENQIRGILESSLKNNQKDGITGLFLLIENRFVQIVYSGQSEPLIPVESEPMIPAQSEPPLRV
jgi:Sensors of blue-light using FAD